MSPMATGSTPVGFQGITGAFSEQAIADSLDDSVSAVGYETFEDLGLGIEQGQVEFGMLPIENTLAGSIAASYDLLITRRLDIVAEVVMPVRQCVVGLPGATTAGLRRIASHPAALAQCRRFFLAHRHIEPVADYDTAGAAKRVAESADPAVAAIAACRAAALYGLAVLVAAVQDRSDNRTRFYLLRRPGGTVQLPLRECGRPDRAAIVACVVNEPRALASILEPIARAGVNVSKIERRPAVEPCTCQFVLELDLPGSDEAVRAVVDEMAGAGHVRVLGRFSRILLHGHSGRARPER